MYFSQQSPVQYTQPTVPSTVHPTNSPQYSTPSPQSPVQYTQPTVPSTVHPTHSPQYSTPNQRSPVQYTKSTVPSTVHPTNSPQYNTPNQQSPVQYTQPTVLSTVHPTNSPQYSTPNQQSPVQYIQSTVLSIRIQLTGCPGLVQPTYPLHSVQASSGEKTNKLVYVHSLRDMLCVVNIVTYSYHLLVGINTVHIYSLLGPRLYCTYTVNSR